MRPILLLLAPLALLGFRPAPALAWEDTGHRLITLVSAESFPAGLPDFLRTPETARMLMELAREPDRSRGAGQPHDADLDPGHFIDVDDGGKANGGPSLSDLPANRAAYEKALQAAGTDSWKTGWLPYSIIEGWQQLTKDFAYWRVAKVGERTGKTPAERAWFANDRKLREMLIIRDLGYWSHFVGDGSQPLHATIHFNGWGDFPNPHNYTREKIHAPFEGAFVHDNATAAEVKALMPPYQACGCTVQQATARYLLVSAAKVEPLYQLWDQGGFKGTDPRGHAFVLERLAAGAAELRDLVTDAWTASANATVGYPAVTAKSIEESGVAPFETIYGRE
jgi:hypothetical protein